MRRLIKIILIVLAVPLLVVAGAAVYLFLFDGLEQSINSQVESLLGEDSELQISVNRIGGNFVSGVVLEGITVRYFDSVYNYQIARIANATLGYSISNLWNKKFIFDFIYFDSVDIQIREDSLGRTLFPAPKGDSTSGGQRGLPDFLVENLQLNNCYVEIHSHTDSISVSGITFAGGVQSQGGTISASVNQLKFDSDIEDLALEAASGQLTATGSMLTFQDMTLVSSGRRIKVSGTFDISEITGQIQLDVDQLDLSSITRHIGPKLNGIVDLNGEVRFDGGQVSGTLDLAGTFMIAQFENLFVNFRYADRVIYLDTLYGTILEHCAVDGRGKVDLTSKPELYALDADIKNFNLANLIKGSFTSDLTGRINLSGEAFTREDMIITVKADLHESSFHDFPIHSSLGTAEITTEEIRFLPPFRVDYYENSFIASGDVVYSGDMNLKVEAFLDNLDRYRGRLFIDQPGGRGSAVAYLTGRSADPDLSGRFSSDSLWIYGLWAGKTEAEFNIGRFLTGRRGRVTAKLDDGFAWSLPYDSIRTELRLDSTNVFIESVQVSNPRIQTLAHGVFDYGVYPQQLTLDNVSLDLFDRRFASPSTVSVAIDSNGFLFRNAQLTGEAAALDLRGRIDFDETMNVRATLTGVPVRPWLRLFNDSLDFDGEMSCVADLKGSFMEPEFQLDGSVDSLVYRNLFLGDVHARAAYADFKLSFDSLLIDAHPGTYFGSGSLYLDLAFTQDSLRQRVLDRPMDLRMTATDNRFDLVRLVLPSVEDLTGDFAIDVRLIGTPSNPHLEGSASLNGAKLKYFDLADPIHVDQVIVTMSDNWIILDTAVAYVQDGRQQDKRYYAFVDGEITVSSLTDYHYDLDIVLPGDFPFVYDLEDIRGVVSGRLKVLGDTPPTVSGDLALKSMMYRAAFASADEGSPIMAAFSGESTWDLDINIEITSNYWIKNDAIDAEFAGLMNLSRTDGQYRFAGEMTILRGQAFLFDKRFRIEPGALVIFEDTEYPNPRLDITAVTSVPGVQFEEESRREMVDLPIQVTGTLEAPEFNIESGNDDFGREDLLPWLVGNVSAGVDNGSGQFQQRFAQYVSSLASRIGSRQLSRIGVEEFGIDPAYGSENDLANTQVRVGFYTTRNLYIYGSSTVSFQAGQEVGFEYRFNRKLVLEGRRDEEELYHVNFNLHWEF